MEIYDISDEELVREAPSELPPNRAAPALNADVFLLAERSCWSPVRSVVPDELTLRTFEEVDDFQSALSGNIALVLLSLSYDEDILEESIKEVITASPNARIAVIAAEFGDLYHTDLPYDEGVVRPVDREEFDRLVKRLYIRAYYAVTLQRFYKVSITVRNRELRNRAEDSSDDERLERLKTVRVLLQRYLQTFVRHLDSEDFEAMRNREDRLEQFVTAAKSGPDPSALGLPKACPDCDLAWDTWHGRRLQNGYERLGADVWQCTGCGSVLSNPDPTNFHVS